MRPEKHRGRPRTKWRSQDGAKAVDQEAGGVGLREVGLLGRDCCGGRAVLSWQAQPMGCGMAMGGCVWR